MQLVVDSELKFLRQLPDAPGVYRYFDNENNLLYVGKAISLIKRVKSYFQKTAQLSPRIFLMVQKVASIEITVTDNETSALLLENNLIKTLKPKYNIIFRDDKSYPCIKISRHDYPVIEYFRGKSALGDKLYGPYPNPYAVRETLDLLQRLFRLRTCSDSEFASRSRSCMLHQINLCSAPCVSHISLSDYQESVNLAEDFLCGNYGKLVDQLGAKMYQLAENLEFEQAGVIRDKIGLIQQLQNKQIISDSNTLLNCDIILATEVAPPAQIIIYIIIVRNGMYVGDKHFTHPSLDVIGVITEAFFERYYSENECPELVYSNQTPSLEFSEQFKHIYHGKILPIKGQRIKDLALMGQKNLNQIIEKLQLNNIYVEACTKLASLLNIKTVKRLECYDTSHNHGSSAVASMVVYANGKIDNTLYRRFNLSSEVNGNDLLALELVLRRRLANNELALPEVILVDGGKLQLDCAKNLIHELGFYGKIEPIAIFKGAHRNPQLDRIIVSSTIQLSFREEPNIFKFLQAMRDEAHRFAITGHRKKQNKRMSYTRLEEIAGVGVTKRKALLAFFGSTQMIAEAELHELEEVSGIGRDLATSIYKFFHP